MADVPGIEAVLKVFPWMEAFKDRLRETCHDCGKNIGERHIPGCDAARCHECGGQHMCCGCDTEPDIWTGLMMPNLHYICLQRDLWCYDAIVVNGKEHPVASPELYRLALDIQLAGDPLVQFADNLRELAGEEVKSVSPRVRWHIPCQKDDPGAHPDLNRAAMAQGVDDETVGLWV
jgi:hypothetical protein